MKSTSGKSGVYQLESCVEATPASENPVQQMATSFPRGGWMPIGFVLTAFIGIVATYTVAVVRGKVPAFLPYVSQTGGTFPESGILGTFLILSCFFGVATVFTRYFTVKVFDRGNSKLLTLANRAALVTALVGFLGYIILAVHPESIILSVHLSGAGLFFVCITTYAFLQTYISYLMHPHYNGKAIVYLRVMILIVLVFSNAITLLFAPIGLWIARFKASVMIDDLKLSILISAIGEWIAIAAFGGFFLTFVNEFQKTHVSLDVQPLVGHFDENVVLNSISASNSIVMVTPPHIVIN